MVSAEGLLAILLSWPQSGYVYEHRALYAIERASDATDWGHGAEMGEEEPF